MNYSLEVYHDHKLIFFSTKNWLHPLFDLEDFLGKSSFPAYQLLIKDKIVGRAAALLMVHLKAGQVFANTLSKPGEEVLQHYQIPYEYRMHVDKIGCQTEELLKDILDPAEGYLILKERIRKNQKTVFGFNLDR